MIWNLARYLRNQFPNERVYINNRVKVGTEDFIPDRNVLIIESGGPETPWSKFSEPTIMFTARDKDETGTYKLAWDFFKCLVDSGTFGLILPLEIAGGETYPEIQIAGISPNQTPSNIGVDAEGRILYIFNLVFRFSRR